MSSERTPPGRRQDVRLEQLHDPPALPHLGHDRLHLDVHLVRPGRELGPEGILTNAIAPGIMDTPQLDVDAEDAGVSPEEIRRRYAAESPIGRIGRPEEIAAVVAFLASDAGGAFVGQVVQPNGGTTRGLA